MKILYLAGIIYLLVQVPEAPAQEPSGASGKSRKYAIESGAGLGGYYGTFGTKFSVSGNLLGANLGLGFGPLAKGIVVDISPGVSVYFKDRHTAIRPNLSLLYSRIGYTLNVMEKTFVDVSGPQTVSSRVLYQENFPGAAVLGGVDWRLGKKGMFCINLDIGYVYPFAGYGEVRQIKDEQVSQLRSEGYIIEDTFGMDKVTVLDFVDFSFGISYALGRGNR